MRIEHVDMMNANANYLLYLELLNQTNFPKHKIIILIKREDGRTNEDFMRIWGIGGKGVESLDRLREHLS